jgi:hypothetical protein
MFLSIYSMRFFATVVKAPKATVTRSHSVSTLGIGTWTFFREILPEPLLVASCELLVVSCELLVAGC